MIWEKLLVRDRFFNESTEFDEAGRSGFQRDIDRIVFSSAFRRLQGKTQVHPLPKNDHIHNRLTHTLEVSSVGRTLGTTVGERLAEASLLPNTHTPADCGSIVQASCLAHDIGNPPFGHACEDSIGDWFQTWFQDHAQLSEGKISPDEKDDLTFFDGNAQGFRLITRLEYQFNEGGMQLSFPVLATFLKYPWLPKTAPSQKPDKASCFLSEVDYLREVCITTGLKKLSDDRWSRHPFAYLVEAADDICYKVIDIEDGIELGILDFDDYKELLKAVDQYDTDFDKNVPPGEARRLFFKLRGRIFQDLINEAVDTFFNRYDQIMDGSFEGELLNESESDIANLLDNASELSKRRVFTDRKKTMIEIGAYANVNITLDSFCSAIAEYVAHDKKPEHTSPLCKKIVQHVESEGFAMPDDLYHCFRGVVDYVSGMTDNYSGYVARQIGGVWS